MYIFSQTDKTSVALTLIENGANMQLQDNEGNTALGTSLPRPTDEWFGFLRPTLNSYPTRFQRPAEYALRNDNPELISVLIEAATGGASQQSQRERRRQENERKRQTAALALPVQVERKIVRGQRSYAPPPRRPAGPSLFGDDDDDDDDLSLFDAEESTAWPSHTTSSSSEKEEKAEGGLTDLFGFGDDDDEDDYVPKGKEVSSSTSHSHSHSGRKVSWADLEAEDDDEQEQNQWQGMIASLFPDDEGDDEEDIFPTSTSTKPSSTTTLALTHPLAQPTDVARSTTVSASASVAIKTNTSQMTVVVQTTSAKATSSATGGEVDQLLAQIQQLEARLAEKDRELLAKDDKISVLEEDTWCRICMDKKIETVPQLRAEREKRACVTFILTRGRSLCGQVLLWCGHNILCTPCSQKVQKSKKDCPVCAKPIARVVRTYRA